MAAVRIIEVISQHFNEDSINTLSNEYLFLHKNKIKYLLKVKVSLCLIN
jgi:hypothetical protein